MVTVYHKYLNPRTEYFQLVDGYGTPVSPDTFQGWTAAKEWAFENGYHISKRPYTPAEVVG